MQVAGFTPLSWGVGEVGWGSDKGMAWLLVIIPVVYATLVYNPLTDDLILTREGTN